MNININIRMKRKNAEKRSIPTKLPISQVLIAQEQQTLYLI